MDDKGRQRSPVGLAAAAVRALGALPLLIVACGEQPQRIAAEPKPPVSVQASVDRAVATTGDVIRFTIGIEHDPGYAVQVPEMGAAIAGFRIIDFGHLPDETIDGRLRKGRWYDLRADLVGSYVLPPIRVPYEAPQDAPAAEAQAAPAAQAREPEAAAAQDGNDEGSGEAEDAGPPVVETSEIFVEVKSVLPKDGEAADIRDVKPLHRVEAPPPWPLIALAAALVLLGLGVGVWLYRRGKRPVAVPPVPPHEEAFAALDGLRKIDFDDPVAVRWYYFDISEVLRAYVEARFRLNATDLTTEEILSRFAELGAVPTEQRSRLKDFLAHTDQVKYAGQEPSQDDIRTTYERALGFVEATMETMTHDAVDSTASAVAQ